jgi:hypothetical protein
MFSDLESRACSCHLDPTPCSQAPSRLCAPRPSFALLGPAWDLFISAQCLQLSWASSPLFLLLLLLFCVLLQRDIPNHLTLLSSVLSRLSLAPFFIILRLIKVEPPCISACVTSLAALLTAHLLMFLWLTSRTLRYAWPFVRWGERFLRMDWADAAVSEIWASSCLGEACSGRWNSLRV